MTTVHLLKPALRIKDLHAFAKRQQDFLQQGEGGDMLYPVWTSRRPARVNELINGGSVYWIINQFVRCRQTILEFHEIPPESEEEKPSYLIMCDPTLVETKPLARKPFQGWRYFIPENAPADIGVFDSDAEPPPEDMEKDLKEAGLL